MTQSTLMKSNNIWVVDISPEWSMLADLLLQHSWEKTCGGAYVLSFSGWEGFLLYRSRSNGKYFGKCKCDWVYVYCMAGRKCIIWRSPVTDLCSVCLKVCLQQRKYGLEATQKRVHNRSFGMGSPDYWRIVLFEDDIDGSQGTYKLRRYSESRGQPIWDI